VGRALISEIRLLKGSPETAPEGSALMAETRELSAAGLEGRALRSETRPPGPFVGAARILDIKEPTPDTAPEGSPLT
jgi:hypothetical protein